MLRQVLSVLGAMLLAANVYADEHVVWNKEPIQVTLSIGHERQLVFPGRIEVGIPRAFYPQLKTVTSVDNRLFIEPAKVFENQKVLIKDVESGNNYVLVLSVANQDSALPDTKLIVHKESAKREEHNVTGPGSAAMAGNQDANAYPFLTRYVMQHLYAPQRLVQDHPGIQRISVDRVSIGGLFQCSRNSNACRSIVATPIVGFRTDRIYATALLLRNVSDQPVEVDPRLLKRNPHDPSSLLASTAMHGRLLPAGSGSRSETTLVILHTRPLREILPGVPR
jgi:integrating conjugative element protein (TIGR03749 family)